MQESFVSPYIDQEVEVSIERLGSNGEGIGYWNGFTLFVDNALPDERIKAKIYERRKNYGRAKIVEHLHVSSHRENPLCHLFGRCGGCQLMHLEYSKQLETKRQRVVDALERIAKIFDIEVFPCEPSVPFGYRNKIQMPVVSGRLGLYARNTHDLVEVEQCFIHCDLGETTFKHIQALIQKFPLSEKVKHVLIKTAVHTKQILVIFVTSSNDYSHLSPLIEKLMEAQKEIKGVVQNINPAENNVILSHHYRTLAGIGWIEETLLGLSFKVSPASFFQVNPTQAERLYQKVVEFSALSGKEIVLDAYCGVGTLSLILAQHAKEVIGVECVNEAIIDAKENAVRNHISNAIFTCSYAEKFITTLTQIDVAILNPPRKGCESSFLEKLIQLKPSRIVYVSCDPATLARDLSFLCSKGYRIEGVQPFDMFPQTSHVECVVKLTFSSKSN